MKKVLSIIAIILTIVLVPTVNAAEKPKVTDHEKVTIYIFRGNGCGYCANAINYFYGLGDEYADYFEVKTYETWYNSDNKKLANEVAEKFDYDLNGVPFIVVGEKYETGFGSSTGETLIEWALEYYEDKKYKDVVETILSDIDYEVEMTTLEEAYDEETSVDDTATDTNTGTDYASTSNGKYDTIIIIGIFVVLIGGLAGLVIVGRK